VNVLLVRGAGTDSGQGGQRFLEKTRREALKIFFSLPTLVFSLQTLDLIAWVAKTLLRFTKLSKYENVGQFPTWWSPCQI